MKKILDRIYGNSDVLVSLKKGNQKINIETVGKSHSDTTLTILSKNVNTDATNVNTDQHLTGTKSHE